MESPPLTYRPISLASISCKILGNTVYPNSPSTYPFEHVLLTNPSSEPQLAPFIHNPTRNTDDRLQTDAIFLDFPKALDAASHSRLTTKLSTINLSQKRIILGPWLS